MLILHSGWSRRNESIFSDAQGGRVSLSHIQWATSGIILTILRSRLTTVLYRGFSLLFPRTGPGHLFVFVSCVHNSFETSIPHAIALSSRPIRNYSSSLSSDFRIVILESSTGIGPTTTGSMPFFKSRDRTKPTLLSSNTTSSNTRRSKT